MFTYINFENESGLQLISCKKKKKEKKKEQFLNSGGSSMQYLGTEKAETPNCSFL